MISFSMTAFLFRLTKYFSCIALLLFLGCGFQNKEKEMTGDQTEEATAVAPETSRKTIVFFGNSLTAGFGLPQDQAYPALIQQKIDSLGWPFQVVNAGVSGDTSEGGLSRLEWTLQQPVAIFVLELGANDGLRGVDLKETRTNLDSIIGMVHRKDSTLPVILAGMKIPPNFGVEYASGFESIFKDLGTEDHVHLVPFLLKDVAGKRDLNLPDGIHPNAAGHKILARNVWKVLRPVLEKEMKTIQ